MCCEAFSDSFDVGDRACVCVDKACVCVDRACVCVRGSDLGALRSRGVGRMCAEVETSAFPLEVGR